VTGCHRDAWVERKFGIAPLDGPSTVHGLARPGGVPTGAAPQVRWQGEAMHAAVRHGVTEL